AVRHKAFVGEDAVHPRPEICPWTKLRSVFKRREYRRAEYVVRRGRVPERLVDIAVEFMPVLFHLRYKLAIAQGTAHERIPSRVIDRSTSTALPDNGVTKIRFAFIVAK